ncbi:MAG: rod shape-determining protein RodA, partial [Candidatus Omnitrophica bacterium]|nr:rod shape-determining protein RodA [Candidatus Omnitrophota bacterium]
MLVVLLIGLFCLHSASYNKGLELGKSFVLRQLIWVGIGLFIFIAVLVADYQRAIDFGYVFYAAGLFLLLLVLSIGHTRLGAQRWFSIAGFSFQPSEFMKIIYIITLTSYLGHARASILNIKGLIVPIILTAIPFMLILMQPDLGTALILVPVFFVMLFVVGVPSRHLAGLGFCGLVMSPIFWNLLKVYQKKRLLVFLNPNIDPLGAGYTIIQSKIAIGSGGLFGKGWLSGTQNQLNFLPERHTDFIFSVIGEEGGFFGAIVLVGLYFLILKRGLMIIE